MPFAAPVLDTLEVSVAAPATRVRTWWTAAAYAYALTVAASVAYCVWGIPLQLSDSLGNLLQVQEVPLARVISDQLATRAYLRPLLWGQIKVVLDASGGHYFRAFKTVHALQLIALAILFVRPLQIRSARDFWPLPLAAAVLVGLHTFTGTVREAFPINSYLTMVLCCLGALNLSMSREGRTWKDAAAALLLAFAVLTIESGVLVFVCFVAAWFAGFRGVSRRGMAVCGIVMALYFAGRFLLLDASVPGLSERSSGFGFEVLEPNVVESRFGTRPFVFYAHNVVVSLLSVLFSEPRGGVFWAVKSWWVAGGMPVSFWVNLVSSILATTLVAWHLVAQARGISEGARADRDRMMSICGVLLAANAIISFGYTKDVILSIGGVFYALAVYVSARAFVERCDRIRVGPVRFALVALACVASMTWAARQVSLPVNLRQAAARERTQWVHVQEWLEAQHIVLATPAQRALVDALRADALSRPVPLPVRGPWTEWLDLN